MTRPRYLPTEELNQVRWVGRAFFQCLGHSFSVRWNRAHLGKAVDDFLGFFCVPKDLFDAANPAALGQRDEYSLIDFGPSSKRKPRYKLLYGNRVMNQSPDSALILNIMFSHVNTQVFRRADHFLMIHAGAVATPSGEGVILPGGPGFGKTTLVTGLVQEGFGYLSDEVAAIHPVTGRLHPYPQTLILKEGSFKLFPTLKARAGRESFVSSLWYLHPDDIRPGAVAGPCEVRFVIFARYEEGAPTELVPVSRGASVQELMTAAFNLSMYSGRALQILADSVRLAQTYRLVISDLMEAVQAVASLTSTNGHPTPSGRQVSTA